MSALKILRLAQASPALSISRNRVPRAIRREV
jgi:hypothetical protein